MYGGCGEWCVLAHYHSHLPPPSPLPALIMGLWFLPETVRENKRMQTKRAMLLYLPIVVVASIKSIRQLIDDICASEGANALGGGGGAATPASGGVAGASPRKRSG